MTVAPNTCAICGTVDPYELLLGMNLYPAVRTDAYEQLFVHPTCISRVLRPGSLDDVCEDLVEMFGKDDARGAARFAAPPFPESIPVAPAAEEVREEPEPKKPAPRRRTRRKKDETT